MPFEEGKVFQSIFMTIITTTVAVTIILFISKEIDCNVAGCQQRVKPSTLTSHFQVSTCNHLVD